MILIHVSKNTTKKYQNTCNLQVKVISNHNLYDITISFYVTSGNHILHKKNKY